MTSAPPPSPGIPVRTAPAEPADDGKEFWACLTLRHTVGMGPRTWKSLLEYYGSAREAVADHSEWLKLGLVRKNQADAFRAKGYLSRAESEWRLARGRGFSTLLYQDPRYPRRLKDIPDPPLYLYYRGDISLLAAPSLAVVGSREASNYGLKSARHIARDLSRSGLTVISGFALGVDREAHLAGLDGPGSSVAVLGTGIDLVYPAQNRDLWTILAAKGLIVSEFSPGARPEPRNFPWRNRVISGLALGVLVIEAATRSGSLITARLALEQGREVFALPGPIGNGASGGCHALIRDGAVLVQSADDVLAELAPVLSQDLPRQEKRTEAVPADRPDPDGHALPPPEAEPTPDVSGDSADMSMQMPGDLSAEEQAVAVALRADAPVHIDDLARRLDWDSGRVSRVLVMLEVRGVILQMPGMRYRPV